MAVPIHMTAEQVRDRRRRLAWGVLILAGILALPQIGPFQEGFVPFIIGMALTSGMVGLSINVLTGYAGQVSLGHAALYGTGAFAAAHLTTLRGLPYWVALPLAALATAGVVLIMGFPALRIRGLHLAIVTLGFQFLMHRIVFRQGFVTGGAATIEVDRPLFLGNPLEADGAFLYVVIAGAMFVLWLDRNLTRTRAGRAFFAIREDEQVAASFGIDVARYKLLAFVLSGLYAGLAGGLFAGLQTTVSVESFDYPFSLEFLAFAVIGGLGSRPGTMIGAMIPVFFQQAVQGLRSWGVVLGGVLLVLTLVRYRGGLAEQGRELRHIGHLMATRIRSLASAGAAPDEPVDVEDTDDATADVVGLPVALGRPVDQDAGAVNLKRKAPTSGKARGHLLEVHDAAIRFGGVQALGGVSVEVREGEIVGVMGPNGAGKTTLFNCISGFAKPQSGAIRFRGRDLAGMPPHDRAVLGMGRTFQNIGLVKSETVESNLLIAQHTVAGYGPLEGLLHNAAVQLTERALRDRARYVTHLLGLDNVLEQRVHDLPHGLLKVVELGCALITGPELLLLDEPSSGMSPGESDQLGELLVHIRDAFDVTVLMIEHHVPLVLAVADYVYVLNFGRVLASGRADEIARDPQVMAAYLGESEEDLGVADVGEAEVDLDVTGEVGSASG